MNPVSNFLYHLTINKSDRWFPLLSVYYLTYACHFRCPYCSDGAGQPYYKIRAEPLAATKVLELLRIIRTHTAYLVLTGGEPTQHPELAQILAGLPYLNFGRVIFTTNGYDLEQYLPAIAGSVHELVISLQTLDSARADDWYGHKPGTHQEILTNLGRASQHPNHRYEIIISSVVTPKNIPDLYAVYEFCRERNYRFAACPQLIGVKAHPALFENAAYRQFYDFLIAEKKKGASIHGSVDYLTFMRDLRKFNCRPFTMLVVSPEGGVFYPCLELGQLVGNLFENKNVHALRLEGQRRFGPQPNCGAQCHSACALGFSRVLANPRSVLHEAALLAKSAIFPRNRQVKSARSAAPDGSSGNSPTS